MDKNPENDRIFAEMVGIPWDIHEGWYGNFSKNPDYAADPRLVPREMERIGKLGEFLSYLCRINSMPDCNGSIPAYYILDTTGKLRDAAIGWMKEHK